MNLEWKWCLLSGFLLVCCWHGGCCKENYPAGQSSQLHGLIADAAKRSEDISQQGQSLCRIVLEKDFFVDPDLLKPLVLFKQECTVQGVHPEVSLLFSNPAPLLKAGVNATIRLENFRLYHQVPISLMAVFGGMVECAPCASIEVKNVTLIVDLKWLQWLVQDMNISSVKDGRDSVKRLTGGGVLIKRMIKGLLNIQNVRLVARKDTRSLHWPLPTRYTVDNTSMLMRALAHADMDEAMEISIDGEILLASADLPGGEPTVLHRKLAITGVDETALLKLGVDLKKTGFVHAGKGGIVVIRDISLELFGKDAAQRLESESKNCELCHLSFVVKAPMQNEVVGNLCDLYTSDVVWRTDCKSVKSIKESLQSISANASHPGFMELGFVSERTVQIKGGIIHGICMTQTNITCTLDNETNTTNRPHVLANNEYAERKHARMEQTIRLQGSLDEGRPANRHDNNFLKYGPILVGVLVATNTLLLLIVVWSKRQQRRIIDRKKIKMKKKGREGHNGSDSAIVIPPGGIPGANGASAEPSCEIVGNGDGPSTVTESFFASENGMELLHEINEERQEIGDETMEVKEQVGSGGYGVVHKAIWHGLPVAVKKVVFQDTNGQGSRHKKRAIFEAAISSSISHRNIVQTYTYHFHKMHPSSAELEGFDVSGLVVTEEPTVLWKMHIVLEFCELGSLLRSVRRGIFVDMETRAPDMFLILHLAHDIASGMQHLHFRNIIHGDLTAKNVLLKQEGEGIVAKISDFGLSVVLRQHQSHVSDHRAGTPLYMAPEVRSNGHLSKPADVYSFGVILWELFHLSLGTPIAFPRTKCSKPRFSPSCPMPYVLLCATCLNPNPAERMDFSRCVAILRGLVRLFKSQPLSEISIRDLNEEWMELSVGLDPLGVIDLLERRLLPDGSNTRMASESPTGSAFTDGAVFSTKSVTPDLHPKEETFRSTFPHHSVSSYVTTEETFEHENDDEQQMEEFHQESVTVELSISGDNDMLSFGWVNSPSTSWNTASA